MRSFLFLSTLILISIPGSAQKITLSDLFRFRNISLDSIEQELFRHSFVKAGDGRYTTPRGVKPIERLEFNRVSGNSSAHTVEYYTRDQAYFMGSLRDSLEAYGYVPDVDYAYKNTDAMATRRRWKKANGKDTRYILVIFYNKWGVKAARIELFEGGR